MHMTDLIEKKKQGQTLTQEELHFIVHGYTAGDIHAETYEKKGLFHFGKKKD